MRTSVSNWRSVVFSLFVELVRLLPGSTSLAYRFLSDEEPGVHVCRLEKDPMLVLAEG